MERVIRKGRRKRGRKSNVLEECTGTKWKEKKEEERVKRKGADWTE